MALFLLNPNSFIANVGYHPPLLITRRKIISSRDPLLCSILNFGTRKLRTLSKLSQYIESLIFVAESPVTVKDIKDSLQSSLKLKASKDEINESVEKLQKKYSNHNFSFELVAISDGFQFMTKAAYHDLVGQYLRIQSKKKLSRAAMETLAIIAYKQPMTKSGIESIRGVNCDYAILKLVEKELVEILGRAQTPGRPILYGTSDKFMDYFGIQDITDLPKLKEIIVSENSIGMEAGLEKMHNEGLTEDYKFHPDPEPINEEVDTTEVSVEIETTEEATPAEQESNSHGENLETENQNEDSTKEEILVAEETLDLEEGTEEKEDNKEQVVVQEQQEEPEITTEETTAEETPANLEEQAIEEQTSTNEEINISEIQNPVETFDIENNIEEMRNEEEGESVNSEEN